MRTLRRCRRWLVPWLAATLLFAQWLTAAYACPQLGTSPVAGEATLVEPAVTSHCAEHGPAALDAEQPQLCKAHCQAGQQTVNNQAGAFDAPPLMLAAAAVVGLVAAFESTLPPPGWAEARATGPPGGAPPLYLSLLVLRN
jgi:hypothetical protein